jgi:hypothetical protein
MSVHNYFHVFDKTDLAVMREQANARAKGDSKYGKQTESVIHLHTHEQPCVGYKHEFYSQHEADQQVLTLRFWEAVNEANELESVR